MTPQRMVAPLILLTTLLAGSAASAAVASTDSGAMYPEVVLKTGFAPQAAAAGDFNEDGYPDLVVPNASSNDMSILLGIGGGLFAPQRRMATGVFPTAVVVNDFNHDHHDDIAVLIRGAGTVALFLGRGDGTFLAPISTTVETIPLSLATGEINHDANPDLVVVNAGTNTLTILLGKGDGSFNRGASIWPRPGIWSVRIGDLNGDAEPDLLVVHASFNGLSLYAGLGDGAFSPLPNIGVNDVPTAAAIVDFNHDGKNDLAVAKANDRRIVVLPGVGSGSFGAAVSVAQASEVQSIEVDDFDADGNADLVLTDLSMDVAWVLPGLGTGQFGPQQAYPVGLNPRWVVTADFDANGDRDFAAVNAASDDVSIHLGLGDGAFPARILISAGARPSDIALHDLDADETLDLVVASTATDDVSVSAGSGTGGFGPAQRWPVGIDPAALAIADFDGDGRTDIAAANSGSRDVSILLATPGGQFQERRVAAGGSPTAIVLADLNSDARADLILTLQNSLSLSVLLGTGNGQFTLAPAFVGFSSYGVTMLDANEDGRADLALFAAISGGLYLLAGHGDGTFEPARLVQAAIQSPTSLVTTDFDGDGHADLAIASQLGAQITVLSGHGEGTFETTASFFISGAPREILAGDLNLDGTADIAAVVDGLDTGSFRGVQVYAGHGDRTFGPEQRYRSGFGSPLQPAQGDVDGDGRVDLVVGNGVSGDVWLLRHNPRLANEPPEAQAGDDRAVECAVADGTIVALDGSGSSDPDSSDAESDIVAYDWFEDFGTASERLLGSGPVLEVRLVLGSHAITLRVVDSREASDTDAIDVRIVDTTPPSLICPDPSPSECASPEGTDVTVTAGATDLCGEPVRMENDRTSAGADASGPYPLGTTPVTFTATDQAGNAGHCVVPVVVRDTIPPSLTVRISEPVLWPPNHELVRETVLWEILDRCDAAPQVALQSVSSSEPDDSEGTGDGSTIGDIGGADLGTADEELFLRAERAAGGLGRFYELKYRALDASGNAMPALAVVTVPRDQGHGPEALLMRLEPDATHGTLRILWPSVPDSAAYDVIAGDLAQVRVEDHRVVLGHVEVLARGTTETSLTEDFTARLPPPGGAFFYLIQPRTARRGIGYGTESAPWPRVPESCDEGCP